MHVLLELCLLDFWVFASQILTVACPHHVASTATCYIFGSSQSDARYTGMKALMWGISQNLVCAIAPDTAAHWTFKASIILLGRKSIFWMKVQSKIGTSRKHSGGCSLPEVAFSYLVRCKGRFLADLAGCSKWQVLWGLFARKYCLRIRFAVVQERFRLESDRLRLSRIT